MKGGREHRVPLAPEALALLADRSLLAPAPSAKIFPTLGVNALANELRKIRPGVTSRCTACAPPPWSPSKHAKAWG